MTQGYHATQWPREGQLFKDPQTIHQLEALGAQNRIIVIDTFRSSFNAGLVSIQEAG